jgi:hypothetical protein
MTCSFCAQDVIAGHLVAEHRCPRPEEPGSSFCLFHKPDKTEEEQTRFYQAVQAMVVRRELSFVGFVFERPCIPITNDLRVQSEFNDFDAPEATLDISHSQWRAPLILFNVRVGKMKAWGLRVTDLILTGCTFSNGIEVSGELAQISLDQCHRATGGVNLLFGEVRIGSLIVQGGNISGLHVGGNVYRGIYISDATIGTLDLSKARIEGSALQIERTRIGTLILVGLQLIAPVRLLDVTVSERVHADGLEQQGTHSFEVADIKFVFSKHVPPRDQPKMTYQQRWSGAAAFFRIAKKRAIDLGDPHRGDYYLLERLCMFRPLSFRRKLGESLPWLWGYGERPWRSVLFMVVAIFSYAIFYRFTSGLEQAGTPVRGMLDALYFSGVTFTTLGYGDILPARSCVRVTAITEALLGAVLISAFVVTLAKKYTRE